MRDALMAVASHVAMNERESRLLLFQSEEDPCLFTTYERFTDRAAMDRHNGSDAVGMIFLPSKARSWMGL